LHIIRQRALLAGMAVEGVEVEWCDFLESTCRSVDALRRGVRNGMRLSGRRRSKGESVDASFRLGGGGCMTFWMMRCSVYSRRVNGILTLSPGGGCGTKTPGGTALTGGEL